MEFVQDEFGGTADLAIHLSPGTPAMQSVWVLLSKTRYPAELIQSHAKTGVRTVSIPFDIAAEYVPASLKRTDEKLEHLTAGLAPRAPEFDEIIGQSPSLERAILRARRSAPHDVPVLIAGEPGTRLRSSSSVPSTSSAPSGSPMSGSLSRTPVPLKVPSQPWTLL